MKDEPMKTRYFYKNKCVFETDENIRQTREPVKIDGTDYEIEYIYVDFRKDLQSIELKIKTRGY